jgi:hypothetical protein
MGIAMLVNHSTFPTMIGQLAQDQGLIFLSGILSLLGGIAIVRVHNIWTGGWPVIITVVCTENLIRICLAEGIA